MDVSRIYSEDNQLVCCEAHPVGPGDMITLFVLIMLIPEIHMPVNLFR